MVGFRLTSVWRSGGEAPMAIRGAKYSRAGLSSFKVLLGVVGGADVEEPRLDVERVAIKRVAGNANIVGYDAG